MTESLLWSTPLVRIDGIGQLLEKRDDKKAEFRWRR